MIARKFRSEFKKFLNLPRGMPVWITDELIGDFRQIIKDASEITKIKI
jgi:hypothetical protein